MLRKLVLQKGAPVVTDRLGSVRYSGAPVSYYPWGEDRTSAANGQVKFGTYYRDAQGQDYADQRYYTATAGRFWTPDPSTVRNVGTPEDGSTETPMLDVVVEFSIAASIRTAGGSTAQ